MTVYPPPSPPPVPTCFLNQLTAVLPDPEWVKLEHPDNDPDADDSTDWGELLVSVQVRTRGYMYM